MNRMNDLTRPARGPAPRRTEAGLPPSAPAEVPPATAAERVQEFVIQNPAVALGVALSMGVLLGWLLKRR